MLLEFNSDQRFWRHTGHDALAKECPPPVRPRWWRSAGRDVRPTGCGGGRRRRGDEPRAVVLGSLHGDAARTPICAGTNEVMKVIIAKSLGL